jgi:hypothetical protein
MQTEVWCVLEREEVMQMLKNLVFENGYDWNNATANMSSVSHNYANPNPTCFISM